MIDRSQLSALLSDDLGILEGNFATSDDSLSTVASKSLRASFLKKLEGSDGFTPTQMAEGERLFKLYNDHCKEWSLPQLSEVEKYILDIFRVELSNLFHHQGGPLIDLAAISELGNLGPGANISAQSYNFYSKLFDSRLTMTSDHLLRIYRSATFAHTSWADAEKARLERHGYEVVDGSSLFHVAKDTTRTRTAATEPTLNMFVQKAIGSKIEERMKAEFGIDLSRQPDFNRLLAQLGSQYGTFGTIDLKSASDCIALGLCEEFLPGDFVSWLKLSRSPTTVLPDGQRVTLGLVSSMGNGFTFPLQTALFACLVRACYIAKGVNPKRCGEKWSNYGVFGDDIVVRKDCFDIVCHMLQLLRFFVNDDKSFNVGHFRESCGGDFWQGRDVRGVYLKKLETQGDLFSAINRLAAWSAKWGILLSKTIAYLKDALEPKMRKLFVPLHSSDDSGLKVSLACAREAGVLRWEKRFQCVKYKALEPAQYRVTLREARSEWEMINSDNFGLFYSNKLISKRSVDSKGNPRVPVGYNPNGLLVTLLGGFIVHGALTLRQQKLKRKVVNRHTSSWDVQVCAGRFSLDNEWQFIVDGLLK